MIKLFLADIDGCLSAPYAAYDLDAFNQLAEWGRQAEEDPTYPRIGLMSGRAYAYVEAVAQALDLRAPALFESGGGRFDLPLARIRWSPLFTDEDERALVEVRSFLVKDIVSRSQGLSLDYGKRTQAGIVGADTEEVARFVPSARAFVTKNFPSLVAYDTLHSVDVVPAALTKVRAVRTMAAEDGLKMAQIAFVGDTNGDAEALAAVGHGFAPANARPEAMAAAQVVTSGAFVAGVLEAYQNCLRINTA